jgi:uncharacterized protein YdeI (YjbR/CyaY-like superfamily)
MELYFKTREEWRSWLEENHLSDQGIWFVYYKKPSGKPSVSYNDAVEEALCFGWIDGKIKRVNDYYYIQWFTQRRQGSRWSKLNISRVKRLISGGRMTPHGMKAYEESNTRPGLIYEIKRDDDIAIPEDLINALKNNNIAYDNFMKFPRSSRNLYVFWLNDAKRSSTRQNRLIKIVDRSERNLKAGII